MDALLAFVSGMIGAVNKVSGSGLGVLALILALVVVWKK